MMRNLIVASMAAALGAGVVSTAIAAEKGKKADKTEKCYGVAKAGKNDCASAGNNSCAGQATKDADGKAWISVPAGLCAKLNGGASQPQS
jgi:uncharacterized membrane protein